MPYITPQSTPDTTICRVLLIPDELYWLAAVQGALDELTKPYNWEQVTGITPQEAAERAIELVQQTYEGKCMPIGSIISYAGNEWPDGYVLCDGQRYHKDIYPKLYEKISTNLIDPSDNDYFFVPDLVSKFLRGGATSAHVGQTGGSDTVTLTEDELPEITVIQNSHNHLQNEHAHWQAGHNHAYDKPVPNLDLEAPGAPDILGLGSPFVPAGTTWKQPEIYANTATNQPTTATNQPFGGGQAHENRPPYFTVRFYIKAEG